MTATADNDQSRVRSLHEKGDCHRRCKSTVGTLATAFARRCPFRNPQLFRQTIDVLRAGVLLGMRHVDKPGCRWMRLYQSCLRLLNVMWAIQDKKACDRNQKPDGEGRTCPGDRGNGNTIATKELSNSVARSGRPVSTTWRSAWLGHTPSPGIERP